MLMHKSISLQASAAGPASSAAGATNNMQRAQVVQLMFNRNEG
jgi:hypothetical protein